MAKRYFEWIAGEDMGNVVTLESMEEVEGEIIYTFDDGETVNQRFISPITDNLLDLKEKVMVEVENPSNVWRLETVQPKIYRDTSMEEAVEIPTLEDAINAGGASESVVNSNIGSKKLVPPANKQRRRDLPRLEDFKAAPVQTPQRGVAVVLEDQGEQPSPELTRNEPISVVDAHEVKADTRAVGRKTSFDPVVILVERCKKHPTKISLELMIDLPSKSMYSIAESEFENGGEAFINHVVSGIDTKIIIDELRTALGKAYGAPGKQDGSE